MKAKTDEFYIGWQPEAPADIAGKVRFAVIVLLLIVPLIGAVTVMNQSGFASSNFELGQFTSLEGVLVKTPAPFLLVFRGIDVDDKPVFQQILLVAPGKHGASEMLSAIEQQKGINLDHKMVRLSGSLIYHDGKTLLEMHHLEKVIEDKQAPAGLPVPVKLGSGALPGEITDPKCLFGVMKPGEGKPHRSCAARCIAGGIPPVFKTVAGDGQAQYFLLTNAQGHPLNQETLPFVGDAVWICGDICRFGDWLVFYKNEDKNISLATKSDLMNASMCVTSGK
ncbi:MAG: hypothetical protein JNK77_06665 [Saprospiraceae bacterium]|nr:hypothetical protein [Saprospiraceae bacterium]